MASTITEIPDFVRTISAEDFAASVALWTVIPTSAFFKAGVSLTLSIVSAESLLGGSKRGIIPTAFQSSPKSTATAIVLFARSSTDLERSNPSPI